MLLFDSVLGRLSRAEKKTKYGFGKNFHLYWNKCFVIQIQLKCWKLSASRKIPGNLSLHLEELLTAKSIKLLVTKDDLLLSLSYRRHGYSYSEKLCMFSKIKGQKPFIERNWYKKEVEAFLRCSFQQSLCWWMNNQRNLLVNARCNSKVSGKRINWLHSSE